MLFTLLLGAFLAFVIFQSLKISQLAFFSPWAKFPGPAFAAFSSLYKVYIEVFLNISWTEHLAILHKQYGNVVRVGPKELHFSTPEAYGDIYNANNRWDKDERLYRCFGEDESSFGYLTYEEARERKEVLRPLFSRNAVTGLQGLVQEKLDHLCTVLSSCGAQGKSANIFFGARCFTMDVITSYCFNRSVDATSAPDFRSPIIVAMEASLSAIAVFKHFSLIRKFVFNLPPWLSYKLSPETAGLVQLQQILGQQVKEVIDSPELLEQSPHPIIYHQLLKPTKSGQKPSGKSLYEEAQALMFGGGDTAGNALFLGVLHLLEAPEKTHKLKQELRTIWPDLRTASKPKWEDLEKLPYLTAVVKESLRISPGVAGPLLRNVPASGALIAGHAIPGGTVVGMSSVFIHNNENLFQSAAEFLPDRWLDGGSARQEWLVAFSRGPRSCLGSNLALCELYLAFANLFRKFDMQLDNIRTSDLRWKERFLPKFETEQLNVFVKDVMQ